MRCTESSELPSRSGKRLGMRCDSGETTQEFSQYIVKHYQGMGHLVLQSLVYIWIKLPRNLAIPDGLLTASMIL